MKKVLLTLATVCTILVISCKKESGGSDNQQVVSSKDPVTLSKSLKIWHATRLSGIAPSPTGGANAPSVTGPSDKVQALNGQFAIIKPQVLNGSVAGYYIEIDGSGEYFKLDYSKPRNAGRPAGRNPRRFLQRPQGGEDSSIVIAIPSNLQVPDTFCITYCPYDSLGNVGQPVTTCIYVSQLGGDASTAWLSGNWRIVSVAYNNGASSDTFIYNTWLPTSIKYYCYDDQQGSIFITPAFDPANPTFSTDLHIGDSSYHYVSDFSFGVNGGMSFVDSSVSKVLDISSGSCSSSNFRTDYDVYHVNGGWSITGSTMTIIYLFDEDGNEEYEVATYNISQLDNNTMKLYFNDNPNEWYIWKRL